MQGFNICFDTPPAEEVGGPEAAQDIGVWVVVPTRSEAEYKTEKQAQRECDRRNEADGWGPPIVS